jgi:RNA polymerase sigma-70 factor, ECF subfamily
VVLRLLILPTFMAKKSGETLHRLKINWLYIQSAYNAGRSGTAAALIAMTNDHEITDLLQAWSKGDSQALDKLLPLVDYELRKIAHSYMNNEREGHTLQTTALINEALMRFLKSDKIDWHSRKHFYSIVSHRMRQVLVDHARAQTTDKRGNRPERVDISVADRLSKEKSQDIVVLDAALTKLAQINERQARIVELRYFGGFTTEQVAQILNVSQATVEREWRLARAWLFNEVTGARQA